MMIDNKVRNAGKVGTTGKVTTTGKVRNLKLVRPEAPVQIERRKLLVNEDGTLVADFDPSRQAAQQCRLNSDVVARGGRTSASNRNSRTPPNVVNQTMAGRP